MNKKNASELNILNIEPYNDIWYHNCYFHALFPIIKYFNKSYEPFFLNDIYIYTYKRYINKKTFDMKLFNIKPENTILNEMNIFMNAEINNKDIIEDIIASINNENPVVVCVDCYYESIRIDTYKKHHLPHCFFVYGYNKSEKYFNIIEHNYTDSLLFEKRKISFADIVLSCNGYYNNIYKKNSLPTYQEFYCTDNKKVDINIYLDIYYKSINKNREKIINSLEALRGFVNQFNKMCLDEKKFKNKNHLVKNIIHIAHKTLIRSYQLEKVLGQNNNIVIIATDIANNWKFVRGVILKYQLNNKYKKESFKSCAQRLNDIYILEKNLFEELLLTNVNAIL